LELEEELNAIDESLAGPLRRRQSLIQHQAELTALCERLSCYRGLEFPLYQPDKFSFLHFVTGSLPDKNMEIIENTAGEKVLLFPLAHQDGRRTVLAVTTRRNQQSLEDMLQQADFHGEALPVAVGTTVDSLCEEKEMELREVLAELEEVRKDLRMRADGYEQTLADIKSFVDIECRLLDAGQMFSRTGTTVLLAGWVPAHAASTIEHSINENTGGHYAITTTPAADSPESRVPVLLRHSRLLRPFEMLVSTYGLPSYSELEPTLFVAISYMVMFGMMFGDAGHGLVLALGGLFMLIRSASEKVRDFGLLVLLGGSSSIVSGVIYGSYFGIGFFKKFALWHDPLEGDPIRLMYAAIGFGIVMISLGGVLNTINRFRQGDIIGGFLDKFGFLGLVFYWGALILLTNASAIESRGLLTLMLVLFIALPIAGWAIKEPLEHILARSGHGSHSSHSGLAGAIIESFVGAFEAILSYLANTISFVRLAAYAMSHAALLVAAFMLAAQVKDVSFGGSLWSLLVIIFGNLIAIVLEGIIASVQALRLEYYEFFGKFFSGSGQPFKPFRIAPDGQAPAS
jgi:V/A-type H+-transporting ATPase subunit I